MTYNSSKTKIYVGTSGWTYKHWFGTFYPEDLAQSKAFQYYQSKFSTVELNVTFYRLVSQKTFEGWYKKTADNFTFAVKGSRYITHNKRLTQPGQAIGRFFENIEPLQEKTGPILWQLPSNFHKTTERLESFLNILPRGYKHAFEFRHNSWFEEEIYKILRAYNACLVFADSPRWPLVEEVTADFIYLRFHGGKVLYGSQYSKEEMSTWGNKIAEWQKRGLSCYTYFNNDDMGFAPKNALSLKTLLSKHGLRAA